MFHGEVGRDCAGVVLSLGERMHVAAQRDSLIVIDEGGDPIFYLDERGLSERKIRRVERGLGFFFEDSGGKVERKEREENCQS